MKGVVGGCHEGEVGEAEGEVPEEEEEQTQELDQDVL